MSEIEKLERLKKLLDDGAISKEEYNSEKRKLLSKKVTNTNKNIFIFLVATFAFLGIYFLISEEQEIQVIEAEIIDTTTTTEPIEELIMDESLVVDSIEDVISATVFINVEGVYTSFDENANVVDFEKEWYGSGFLISSNGYIVTNQHVVSGASIVKIFFYEEDTPRIARVIATSECSDLALLKIDIEDSLFFEWADEQPFVGKEVYAAGYPLGNPEFTLLDGIVTKKEADGETPWASIENTFEHNAEIKQGNSGGPLIGKNDFKVYGVNYAGDAEQQEFAIKNSTAQKVINSMLDGSHMPGFGINGRQYDGIGLFLNSVDIGSPLDIAGLEGGDLITKLAGISLEDKSTLKTYCDILSTQTSGGKVLIEYYSFKNNREYSTILNQDIKDSSVQASDTTTTTTTPATTTTTPATTTTTPATTTTTAIDSSVKDSNLLNFSDIKNEFPEIPYCKYKYDEVADEINKHFQNQDIRITIREMLVETENTECHGLVSGSNFSFKNNIQDGDFVEITVESTKTLRIFPTYIANSPNAKGNNERWNIYCDLTGDSYLSRDWMGEFSGNVLDYYLYSGVYVELNTVETNCVAESVIQKLCYWGWRSNNSGEVGDLLVTGGGIVPALYFNIEKPFPQSWDQSEITYKCSDKEIKEISNTQPSDVNSTNVTDASLTFDTTPPFVYFEIIANKVSDTEIPIINYELAPYAIGNPDSNCNGECFKFYFVQFGWTDSDYSFQLYDNDLDGTTDELFRSVEQKDKPWVYDYWIEEELGNSEAVDWLRLKEDYYFMANQDYLKPNLTSIGIRFCLNEYNRAYRGGWSYYQYRIWPDDCPYNHFFLVYRYGDTVAEVDGNTYPQKPDVVEQYGVRVFGP